MRRGDRVRIKRGALKDSIGTVKYFFIKPNASLHVLVEIEGITRKITPGFDEDSLEVIAGKESGK